MLKLSTNFVVFYLKQFRIIWIWIAGGLKYHLIIISMKWENAIFQTYKIYAGTSKAAHKVFQQKGVSSIMEFPLFITCSSLHGNYGWRLGASSIRRITLNCCVLEFLTSLIAKLAELSWHLTNNFFNDRKTYAVLRKCTAKLCIT